MRLCAVCGTDISHRRKDARTCSERCLSRLARRNKPLRERLKPQASEFFDELGLFIVPEGSLLPPLERPRGAAAPSGRVAAPRLSRGFRGLTEAQAARVRAGLRSEGER